MKHEFVSLEMPQSSICNLDCKYCYIPKNKALNQIHKKWAEVLKSNKYYELISDNFNRETIEAVSLWGAEPSLGFKDNEDIHTLLTFFPKLKKISTSTNLTNLKGWEYLIPQLNKNIEDSSKKISLSIQVSIDGDEEQTDKNRGSGVYRKIKSNLIKLIDICKENENIKFMITMKATHTSEDINLYATDEEKLRNYFSSIITLDEKCKERAKGANNLIVELRMLPTLALPADYTSEDGKLYYKMNILMESILKDLGDKWLNTKTDYAHRISALYNNNKLINNSDFNLMFACSAGNMMLGLDQDGTTHGCHGSFWYNYEDYLESSGALGDWCSGERIVEYEANRYWERMRNYMYYLRDEYNEMRLKSVLEGFIHDIENRLNIALGTVKMLSLAGQISDLYKDDNWAKLFAQFIVMENSCWMNNMIVTGAPSVPPLSIYRIYGNGVFEYLAKQLWGSFNE